MSATMLAAMGIKFVGNFLGGLGEREQMKAQGRLTKAQNKVDKATIDGNNLVRGANNELASVVGSLNRFRQNANNRQVARNSGDQQETIYTNLQRTLNDLQSSSLEDRLNSSFELGALAASTAAAGVGGGSKDVMNATLRMAAARKQQALDEQSETLSYDALKAITNVQARTFSDMDSSLVLDNLDLSQDQYIPKFIQKAPSALQVGINAAVQTAAQSPEGTQMALEKVGNYAKKSWDNASSGINLRI